MRMLTSGCGAFGLVLLSQGLAYAQPAPGYPPQPVQPAPGYPPQPVQPAPGYPPPAAPVGAAPPPQGPVGSYPVAPTPAPVPVGPAPQYSQAPPQNAYQYPAPPPPTPYVAPPQGGSEAPPASPLGPGPGPYFGAWVGAGGPFGGLQTSDGDSPQLSQGFGFLGTAGYAFIPNFGAGVFVHYNATEQLVPEGALDLVDDNGGSVLLYGLEARGILGSGPLAAWLSLGLAVGSGSLDLAVSEGEDFKSTTAYELDWKIMPVLGFGAEAEVVSGLSVGPHIRWYVTSADEACYKSKDTSSFGGGPDFVDTYTDCTSDFGEVTIPDILFLGIGATYRLDLGG